MVEESNSIPIAFSFASYSQKFAPLTAVMIRVSPNIFGSVEPR